LLFPVDAQGYKDVMVQKGAAGRRQT